MPGPVSDSYDPEFGTGENAGIIADAMTEVRDKVAAEIGQRLRDILAVCREKSSPIASTRFTERELRIIRFSINRALESI